MLAPLDTQEDEDLLARLRAGDEVAFRALVDRHRPWLVRLCTRLLGDDAHAAEDAAQESLLKLHAAARRDARPLRIRAWLTVVARNTCVDEQRRRRPDLPGVLPERPVQSDDPFALDAALADAWPRLSGRHREVLYLREVLGFSYKEIASVMGLSMPAIETLVFRARAALRREYERAGGTSVGCGLVGFHLLRRNLAMTDRVPMAATDSGFNSFISRLSGLLTSLPGCGEQAVAKVLSVAAGVAVAAATVIPGLGPFADGAAVAAPASAPVATAAAPPAAAGAPETLKSLLGAAVPDDWAPHRSRGTVEASPTTGRSAAAELAAAAPVPPARITPLRDAVTVTRSSERPTLRRDDASPGPMRTLLASRPEGMKRPSRPAEAQPVRSLLTAVPTLLDPPPIDRPDEADPAPAPLPLPEADSHPVRQTVEATKDAVPAPRETLSVGDGNVVDREPTLLQR